MEPDPAPSMGLGRYEKDRQLGEGTYGVVYKAYDRVTEQTVAIKKIRLGKIKEGVNMTALREIKLLNEIKSPSVINLIDVFPHKRNISLVFEYMESDLEAVITDKAIHLSPGDIKSYMKMTLEGLAFCHANWVVHRDVKPNNLLLAKDGTLKLADFGLARIFGSPPSKLSTQVFARWYRAPELLFGCKSYGGGVDIWAAGCILAELLLRRAFLQGTSDIDQLGRIFAALGTPTEEAWPGMKALPDFVEYQRVPAPPLRSIFPGATDDCLDLVGKMLAFDPLRRITAEDALKHRWFTNPPLPTPPAKLPKPVKREDAPLGLPPGEAPAPAVAAKAKRDGAGGGLERVGSDVNMDMLPPDGRSGKQPRVSFSPMQGPRRTSFPPPGMAPVREAESRNPVTANATAPRAADVHMLEGDTPGSAMPMSTSGGQMMSTDGEGASARPGLNSVDLAYLRKRKLNMDMMFNEASQEEM